MSRTDTIADVLTIIRNGSRAGKEKVDLPSSAIVTEMLRILKREGYIANYRSLEGSDHGVLRAYLKYRHNKRPVITHLARISKPGLRSYAKHNKLPRVLRGLGMAILTTSKGIMTDKEAREARTGGEVLCYVW